MHVKQFKHPWGQHSILATFHPDSSSSSSHASSHSKGEEPPTIVIGAHQDSANLIPFLPAPGADDDGSGSISILQAFRALCHVRFQPTEQAVAFVWFSAEEGGLLGSQAVAADYAHRSVNVTAMMQIDMTAFVKQGTQPSIGIITDFTHPHLTDFNRRLVHAYADVPPVDTLCGSVFFHPLFLYVFIHPFSSVGPDTLALV